MEPGPHDINWAAGLFEGEGTFHQQRHDQPGYRTRLELSITMTDRDVLERFREVVGCGSVRSKTARHTKPHWKPQYIWRTSAHASQVAERLRPFLGQRRRARLDEILNRIEESKPKPKPCECCATVFTPKRFARQAFCTTTCADRGKYLRRKFGTTSITTAQAMGYTLAIDRPEHRTHCPSGHPLSGTNLYVYHRRDGRTERRCKTCARERARVGGAINGTRPGTNL